MIWNGVKCDKILLNVMKCDKRWNVTNNKMWQAMKCGKIYIKWQKIEFKEEFFWQNMKCV